jgi:hypothetical protein
MTTASMAKDATVKQIVAADTRAAGDSTVPATAMDRKQGQASRHHALLISSPTKQPGLTPVDGRAPPAGGSIVAPRRGTIVAVEVNLGQALGPRGAKPTANRAHRFQEGVHCG